MKVLVLGGYGLIGAAVVDRLLRDGHEVSGLGRTVGAAGRRRPDVHWVAADMARMLAPQDWLSLVSGMDAVVNAAGALQDGARDDLDAIHRRAVIALVVACEQSGVGRFVQISSVGADLSSPQPFFSTKAAGDHAVASSSLSWTILRPGLVIAPAAYGGTALLRALAAFPCVIPAVMAATPIQTVSVDDVADAVSRAVAGTVPEKIAVDLVEDDAHPLGEVLETFRAWLGLPKAPIIAVPPVVGRFASAVADGLGRLGWRSPLRGAALAALSRGVRGDAEPWRKITGRSLPPLKATLATMPAHVQERWFARLWLLKPFVFACLSLFWTVSGVIGFARFDTAAEVLASRGMDDNLARMAVIAGSLADLTVGLAVLVRPLAKAALWAMAGITLCYLLGASVWAPDLWIDPLGPLVKTLPGLCLVLVALAVLDER